MFNGANLIGEKHVNAMDLLEIHMLATYVVRILLVTPVVISIFILRTVQSNRSLISITSKWNQIASFVEVICPITPSYSRLIHCVTTSNQEDTARMRYRFPIGDLHVTHVTLSVI